MTVVVVVVVGSGDCDCDCVHGNGVDNDNDDLDNFDNDAVVHKVTSSFSRSSSTGGTSRVLFNDVPELLMWLYRKEDRRCLAVTVEAIF